MERRQAYPRLPAALAGYDTIILILALLAPIAGMTLFGAVRLWSIGPLTIGLFLAAALLAARPLVFRGEFPVRRPIGLVGLLPFLCYVGFQIPFAALPYEAWLKALMWMSGAAALLVWTALAGWGQRWRWIMALLLLAITLEAVYGMILNAHGSRAVLNLVRPDVSGMRASGTYFCPNHYAHLLALGLILAGTLLGMPKAGIALKILAGYAAVVIPYPLFLTQSRSGMLGAIGGLVTVGLCLAWRRGRRLFWLSAMLAPFLVIGGISALYAGSSTWHTRIDQAIENQGGRMEAWRTAINIWKVHPWLGSGGGSFRWVEFARHDSRVGLGSWAQYAHNEILHLGAEYGVIGLSLLLAAAGGAAWTLLRLVRRTEKDRDAVWAAGALGAFAGSLIHALFDYNLHLFANTHVLLLWLGVAGGVLYTDGALPVRQCPPRRRRWMAAAETVVWLVLAAGMIRAVASYAALFPAEASLWQSGSRELTTQTAVTEIPVSALPIYDERTVLAGLDRSQRWFDRARQLDPWNWRAYLGLGQVHKMRAFLLEKSDAARSRTEVGVALPWYERALRGNPYEVAAWHGRSHLRSMQGDAEGALDDLRQIIRIMPRNGFFHQRLGVQLLRMGRDTEARTAFEAALKLNRGDRTSRLNLQLLRLRQRPAPAR